MAEHNCPKCAFKAKYDNSPTSFLGRIWRWHTNFCPGWKGYMNSLESDERMEIAKKYNMPKFMS